MKKKLLTIGSLSLLALGIGFGINYNANNKSLNDNHSVNYKVTSILPENVMSSAIDTPSQAILSYEPTPEYAMKKADHVAIVSIISIDGSDIKYDSQFGATYGKMLINNVISGTIEQNTVVDYIKSGAVMTLADWEKGQPQEANDKRALYSNGVDNSKVYYSFHLENNPIVEAGKTYLAYLKYNENLDKYEIVGFQSGFRELNINKQDSISYKNYNYSNYSIKNNETGEFESLSEYINKYFR